MTPQHVTVIVLAAPGPLQVVAVVGLVCVIAAMAMGHVGRPVSAPDCPLCGNPGGAGHTCPRSEGHHRNLQPAYRTKD